MVVVLEMAVVVVVFAVVLLVVVVVLLLFDDMIVSFGLFFKIKQRSLFSFILENNLENDFIILERIQRREI